MWVCKSMLILLALCISAQAQIFPSTEQVQERAEWAELLTYEEGHKKWSAGDDEMVVIVGAAWCGPCQAMKKEVLGHFPIVVYEDIDAPTQPASVLRALGYSPGDSIPVVTHYSRSTAGTRVRRWTGFVLRSNIRR